VFRGALRLLLAAALCAAPALARADTYKWVDADGFTHYATSLADVPSEYRGAVEVIPPPPTGVPNPSSARPPAPPAPPPAPAAVEPTPAQPAPALAPETTTPSVDAAPPGTNEAPAPVPAPAPAGAPGESAAPRAERAPIASIDPRQQEIAQLEAAIERDREELRNLVSTPRWDASELASDPHVREIAERLPRLQAELAALRSEAEH